MSTPSAAAAAETPACTKKIRIRKRSVRFGNPSMFTYHGSVYTAEGGDTTTRHHEPSNVSHRPLVEGAVDLADQNLVAMVEVPPEQVPEGILNLVRAHCPWINHMRIVIEDGLTNEEVDDVDEEGDDEHEGQQHFDTEALMANSYSIASPTASAVESAASILAAEQQRAETKRIERAKSKEELLRKTSSTSQSGPPVTNSRKYLVLFEMADEAAAQQLVEYLHGQPYTCLDQDQTCSLYHVVALHGDDGVSLMSPFFALSTKSNAEGGLEIVPSASSSDSPDGNDLAEHGEEAKNARDCGNATQRHHLPSTTTEDYNCAVCLEHMELDWGHAGGERTSILTTVCNHSFHMECLLQWQDSPCPVCRYDHSGLNEALSRCHVCETTENNFVCLICGVVSCGGAGAQPRTATSTTRVTHRSGEDNSNEQDTARDATSSATFSTSHARQHYDESLHAYALDTETQHVWDFAGGGYVHRLLQNKDDGKLVEVNDPSNTTSQERTLNPGLSEAQEGEVVHRKLEGFASQYYTLLKSQLEQQRIYYEGRLEEVRREHVKEDRPRKQTSDLIVALKHEKHQLSQRLSTLTCRRNKVREDVAFLKNMNESLEENKSVFRHQLQEAQKNRIEMRRVFETMLPPLQQKVTTLMLQLENETPTAVRANEKKPASRRN